ncbi:hypothetical protein IRJ41_011493 [Triplophysa rosa]|uniref:Uncharacterized protein n=1 Tax=Triplophysa rosa TaxID=992332 RepID=A0A9W7TGF2_TRIRA|nr:hypothetical protein IRJ41_011493 [Triplophysa rosa]
MHLIPRGRIAGSIETRAALRQTEEEFIRNAGDGEARQCARQVDRMATARDHVTLLYEGSWCHRLRCT